VLTKSSTFFKDQVALGHGGENTASIDLSKEDNTVFEGYVRWLYWNMVNPNAPKEDPRRHLVCLYALGEKLIDVTFLKAVLEALMEHVTLIDDFPSITAVQIFYDSTKTGSPARRLMVDFWAHSWA
jgi:hypothetical protein